MPRSGRPGALAPRKFSAEGGFEDTIRRTEPAVNGLVCHADVFRLQELARCQAVSTELHGRAFLGPWQCHLPACGNTQVSGTGSYRRSSVRSQAVEGSKVIHIWHGFLSTPGTGSYRRL